MILYPFWYAAIFLLSKLGDRCIWAQRFLIGESYTRRGLHVPPGLPGGALIPKELKLDLLTAVRVGNCAEVNQMGQTTITALESIPSAER